VEPVEVVHYTDPACPWAYSAEPYMTTLRHRYGQGLRWRRVMIGLAETSVRYDRDGYQPVRSARNRTAFARRFGMPFRFEARPRNLGTGRACRAVKAAELQSDDLAEALLRALRFGWFATALLMDTDDGIATMAATVAGLDVPRMLADIDSPQVEAAYQRDWAETRTAQQHARPGIAQGKTADTDGAERFTAPSLVFRREGRELVAVGWQSLDAYDVCIANLAPDLPRQPTPTPADLLPHFPFGLATQEVAVACTPDLAEVDAEATLRDLVSLAADGKAVRRDTGNDAVWLPAGSV
jgi:predicted DsbA family dithiol-disulfide isomerase